MSTQDRFNKVNRIWNYLYAQFEQAPVMSAEFSALSDALEIVYRSSEIIWKELTAITGTGQYYRNV